MLHNLSTQRLSKKMNHFYSVRGSGQCHSVVTGRRDTGCGDATREARPRAELSVSQTGRLVAHNLMPLTIMRNLINPVRTPVSVSPSVRCSHGRDETQESLFSRGFEGMHSSQAAALMYVNSTAPRIRGKREMRPHAGAGNTLLSEKKNSDLRLSATSLNGSSSINGSSVWTHVCV